MALRTLWGVVRLTLLVRWRIFIVPRRNRAPLLCGHCRTVGLRLMSCMRRHRLFMAVVGLIWALTLVDMLLNRLPFLRIMIITECSRVGLLSLVTLILALSLVMLVMLLFENAVPFIHIVLNRRVLRMMLLLLVLALSNLGRNRCVINCYRRVRSSWCVCSPSRGVG